MSQISEISLSVFFLLSQVQFVYFSISQVEYKLGFQVDNFVAMDMPQVNISAQGEVPRTLSGEPQRQCLTTDYSSVSHIPKRQVIFHTAV